ncbi:MAG: hypothetical protein AAB381_02775 [Patescibacteria group bacterium]
MQTKVDVNLSPAHFTVDIDPFPGAASFRALIFKYGISNPEPVLVANFVPQRHEGPKTWEKLWDFDLKGKLEAAEYKVCVTALNEVGNSIGEEGSCIFTLSDEQCAHIMSIHAELHGEPAVTTSPPASPATPAETSAGKPVEASATPAPTIVEAGEGSPVSTTVGVPSLPDRPPTPATPEATVEEELLQAAPSPSEPVIPGTPANFLVKDSHRIVWDEVPDAITYKFLITTADTGIMNNQTEAPQLLLGRAVGSKVLKDGKSYRLTVRALSKTVTLGDEASFDFHVSEGVLKEGPAPVQQPVAPEPVVTPPPPDTREIERLREEAARQLKDAEARHERDTAELLRQLELAKQATTESYAKSEQTEAHMIKASADATARAEAAQKEATRSAQIAQQVAADSVATLKTLQDLLAQLEKKSETRGQGTQASAAAQPQAQPANTPPPAQPAGGRSTARERSSSGISLLLYCLIALLLVLLLVVSIMNSETLWSSRPVSDTHAAQIEAIRQTDEANTRKADELSKVTSALQAKSPLITSPVTHLSKHTLSTTGGTNVSMTLPSTDADQAVNVNFNGGNIYGGSSNYINNHVEVKSYRQTFVHPNAWSDDWRPNLPPLVVGRDLLCGIHEFILAPRDVQQLYVLPDWRVKPSTNSMLRVDIKRGTDSTQQDYLMGNKPGEEVETDQARIRPKAHMFDAVTVIVRVTPPGGCRCPGGHMINR